MFHVDRKSLRPSAEQVEESVPALVYPYRVGLTGGALGGLAMIAVAIMYGIVSGRGFWLPVNLIGATLIRDLQGASLGTLSQFNVAALIAGLLLHTAISIGLGFVFAVLLPTLPGSPLIWSLPIGTLLWSLAGLIALPLLNPIMVGTVDVPSFLIAHLGYGLVLGGWIARTPKIQAE
jgi:hypothetical protein